MQHKSKYQSRAYVIMEALLLVFMLTISAYASPFTAPKKLADYLYYMEYTDYVPDLTTGENVKQGFACSSVRNGNFYGRNLDLDYSDVPEFVIKVAASEGRYASIGMAAILTLKSGEVDKVSEAELLAMPNLTFDGINENGVAMNCNVCPASDLDFATLLSTNYGKPRIHAIAVVRYILDHAKSAAHGVELLKNMDIYGSYGPAGLHWMLSDEKETYIIECIDGELVARNDTDNIMTNFYINYAPDTLYAKHIAQTGQKVAGKVYEGFPILTPHACGVERYAVLKEHYDEGGKSAEGMAHLMERVKYTQAYEADTNPFWYTEFTGENLTIANAPMDFKTVIQYSIDTYKLHDRDIQPNNFWQTWHTAVYDLANRTLRLNIQEDYSKHYDFKLSSSEKTGKAPDYSKAASWCRLSEIIKDVDTFYVYPTEYMGFNEGDPDYAALDNPEMTEGAQSDLIIQAGVYEDSTNVFVPYYRQISMRCAGDAWKKTGSIESAISGIPYDDITAALDYYFENYNNGRPFILAGHSQGSAIAKIVLEKYFKEHPEYYERMVAAYVIGYAVTKDDLEANPHLKFATGESDTGVIVSWNTEGRKNVETNARTAVLFPNAISINPLNWKLDDTYAPASENLGSLVMNTESRTLAIGDVGADAQVVPERGVVVTNAKVEPMPPELAAVASEFFGPDGRHESDYSFYYNNIKDNVAKRIAAYKSSR